MKLLILSSAKSKNVDSLIKQAKKKNHQADFYLYRDLIFSYEPGDLKLFVNGINIDEYDVLILRAPKNFLDHIRTIVYYSKNKPIYCLNEKILTSILTYPSKLSQYTALSLAGLPVVPSKIIMNEIKFKNYFSQHQKPLILKSTRGSLGLQVYKVENYNEAQQIIKKHTVSQLLIQSYIPTREDVRIFVLGGQVLGGAKKKATGSDFRTNIARGGKGEKIKITKEIQELSLKTAEALGAEFCGLDIMYWNNRPYILEANFSPHFESFAPYLDVDIAKKLIQYLENKVIK